MKKLLLTLGCILLVTDAWAFRIETLRSSVSGIQSTNVTITPAQDQTATFIVSATIRSLQGTADPTVNAGVFIDAALLVNMTSDSDPSAPPFALSNVSTMARTLAAAVTAGSHTMTISNTFAASITPWSTLDFSVTALYPNEPGPLDLQMIADITNLDARVTLLETIIPLIQGDAVNLQSAVTLLQSTLTALNFVANVVLNPDGTTTYTYRDGTTYTANPDKINPIVNVTQNPNETQTYTYQDGTSYTTTPSTTNPIVSVVRNPDGTYTYNYKDGATQTFAPLQSVKSVLQNTDGTTTFTYLDGTTYTTVAGLGPTGATGVAGASGGRGKQGKTGSTGSTVSSGNSGSNGSWWPGVIAGVGAGVFFWAIEESQDPSHTSQGDLASDQPLNAALVDPGQPVSYSAQGDVYTLNKQ